MTQIEGSNDVMMTGANDCYQNGHKVFCWCCSETANAQSVGYINLRCYVTAMSICLHVVLAILANHPVCLSLDDPNIVVRQNWRCVDQLFWQNGSSALLSKSG
jgi:hypothetical protein